MHVLFWQKWRALVCVLSQTPCTSSENDVESLQSSSKLRLHGVLGLKGLKDQ